MSFQPVIPASGLAGWSFLQRTYDTQYETFGASASMNRELEYFSENIGEIETAEDLVSDRRLLAVALGAFGLQDDLDNRYFIQKILEEGSQNEDALANKLADSRYSQLSEAFGFGPGEVKTTGMIGKMETIIEDYKVQSFEVAVGEQNDAMRIALYAQRELSSLSEDSMTDQAKWYTMMGLAPLRSMFETALGLPSEFGQIDIDQQFEVFKEKTRALTGSDSMEQFSDAENIEKLTQRYLALSQIAEINSSTSSQSIALTLLQG